MWDLLKRTDIEQAKQQLKLRRAETLQRHIIEVQSCDIDKTELEALNYMIDIFVNVYRKPQKASAQMPVAPPTPNKHSGEKISSAGKHHAHRDHYPRTNFAIFSRAMARGQVLR
jgi:hypothetical protein